MATDTADKTKQALNRRTTFLGMGLLDYLLVFLIVASIALGQRGIELAALLMILTLLLRIVLPAQPRPVDIKRMDVVFALLAFQYFTWHWLVATVHPLVNEPIVIRFLEVPLAWMSMIILLALSGWQLLQVRDIGKIWRTVAPFGLIFVFALFSFDYFTDFGGDGCRAKVFTFNPNVPPVFFTIASLASFLGWSEFSRRERQLRYLIVVLAVIFTSAYTGARMMLIVQVITFGLLAFVLPAQGGRGRWQAIGILGACGVLGLLLGLVFDWITGCSFLQRLGMLGEAVTSLDAESGGVSISRRFDLAKLAFSVAMDSPWLGYGIAKEKVLAAPVYHIHNQYLSWMIWGGVVSLISGLAFLVSATIFSVLRLGRNGLILGLAGTMVIALNSLTDSLLYHDFVNLEFILFMTLIYALGRARLQSITKAD